MIRANNCLFHYVIFTRTCLPLFTDGDIQTQAERRVYTVSLPPQGYIPCLPEPTSCANSESASSGGDTEGKKSGPEEN